MSNPYAPPVSATHKAPSKSALAAFVLQLVSPGGGFFYLGRWYGGVWFVGLLLLFYITLVECIFRFPIVILPALGVLACCQVVTAVVLALAARQTRPSRGISERPLVICVVGMTLWYGLQLATRVLIAEPFRIPDDAHAMEPVLFPGDQFFVAKSGVAKMLEQGDIVVFRHEGVSLVKRVTRGPGEVIVIDGEEIRMGPDAYFVIGDNRDSSYDSRHFGPIKRDAIIGKAVSIWWSRGPDGIRWDQLSTL